MKSYGSFFKYVFFSSIGFLVIVIGSVVLFLFFGGESLCGNKIISSKFLHDNEHYIVVFQRDCGATTGFSTQVSVLSANEELGNESGNLFIADTDHGKAPSGKSGGPKVQISVISKNHVKILVHPKARIFKNESKVNGVKISYGTK